MKIRVFTWRFFLENAGYATPPSRAVCALELARAEQWAEQEGIDSGSKMILMQMTLLLKPGRCDIRKHGSNRITVAIR
jgi:hypothetical protein